MSSCCLTTSSVDSQLLLCAGPGLPSEGNTWKRQKTLSPLKIANPKSERRQQQRRKSEVCNTRVITEWAKPKAVLGWCYSCYTRSPHTEQTTLYSLPFLWPCFYIQNAFKFLTYCDPVWSSKAQYNLRVVNLSHLTGTARRVQLFANMHIFEAGKENFTLCAENTFTVLSINAWSYFLTPYTLKP